jgi:protein tyrosine/serine phosphatase
MNAQTNPPPALEGVTNFRDFGGYATASGGMVRKGLLYRSGHLAEAVEADHAALASLNISHVADLRRPEEREKLPTPPALASRWRTLSHNHPTYHTEPPHLAVLMTPDVSEAAITARMHSGYKGYPFDPALSEVYRAYFDALAEQDQDQAVLVHCHAGKDRTGLLIALTHHILEVSPAALMAGYLRTNAESRVEERLPQVLEAFRKEHGTAPPAEAMRKVLKVEEDYLRTAFTSVHQRHGSLDTYLHQHLGVDQAKVARIRRRLVAG